MSIYEHGDCIGILNDDAWHTVALIWDDTAQELTLWLDGVKVATDASTSLTRIAYYFGGDHTIGASHNGNVWEEHTGRQGYFSGSLEEIRYYNRALTADEIIALTPDETPPPVTQLDFQAQALSHQQIVLDWNDVPDAEWYLLQRKRSGVDNTIAILIKVLPTESMYVDDELDPEATYEYTLDACQAD